MPGQREIVIIPAEFGAGRSPAAHRRQEGHFVTFCKGCRKFGKLLIMRHYDTWRQFPQARMAGGIALEYGAQVGTLGEVGVFRRTTHQRSEEHTSELQSLR